MSRDTKASLWFVIASVLQKGMVFIATPFYTRLLTTEQYGLFSTYNSWLSIITIFATLNLSMAVMNNLLVKSENYRSNHEQILSSLQFLEILLVLFVSGVFLLLNFIFPQLFKLDFRIGLMLCINIFLSSAVSLWTTKEKYDYNYIPVVIVSILVSAFTIAFNLIFIFFLEDKTYSLIYGTVVAMAIFYLPLMVRNLFVGRKLINLKVWAYALAFNLPLIPHYLSMVVLGSSDRIMIERMVSEEAVALYSIPYSIALLACIFTNAINASLVPTIYNGLKENNIKGLDKKINIILAIFAIIVFSIMIIGPEAVLVLGGSNYLESKWVIPAVSASMFFMFLYPLFGNIEFYYEKKWITMTCSIVAAVSNIGLNFIFIPLFGYVAAAFTTLACYMLMAFVHFCFYKHLCKTLGLKKVYDDKSLLIASISILVLMGLSYLLYLNDIVRYIAIGLLLILVLVFLKKIILFFKTTFINNN